MVFECLSDSLHLCNSSSAVFDLVVKSSHLGLIHKALKIVHLAKNRGFMPGVPSYNAILDSILRSKGSAKIAEEVFDEMTEKKCGLTKCVYF